MFLLFYNGASPAEAVIPLVFNDGSVRRFTRKLSYDHENKIVNEYLDRLEAAKKTAAQMRAKAARVALADTTVREGGDDTALGSAVQAAAEVQAARERAIRKRAIALRDDEFLMFNH